MEIPNDSIKNGSEVGSQGGFARNWVLGFIYDDANVVDSIIDEDRSAMDSDLKAVRGL